MAPRTRAVAALALIVVAAAPLAACTAEKYDGVLARQVLAYKDEFGNGLTRAPGATREQFLDDVRSDSGPIPGRFWDGATDPAALGLGSGGIALYDLDEGADGAAFSVLIASGPRDADKDPFVGPDEGYTGPSSIYTCFRYEVEFSDGLVEVWSRDDSQWEKPEAFCAPELVGTLGDGAEVVPVIEFDG
jgi:hypothetical protein